MYAHRSMETLQPDEDLTLFHNIRARERKNLLSFSNDDIEASLQTDFGEASGCRVSATIPMTKGSCDLLLLDAEKSAYDWLLTPPGTPLFPSPNHNVPVAHLSDGLNQSASASRSSRLSSSEELPRSTFHRNASAYRQSTASTGSTPSTGKGRPSSPSLTSSTSRPSPPSSRPTTPTRTTSAPATRLASRCSTPSRRHMNSSPAIRSSSASKVGSANGKIRGKSLSPKLQRWGPSMTDFLEPPPNLRTSLSDRSIQRGKSLGFTYGGTAGFSNSTVTVSESNRSHQHITSLDVSKGHCLSNSLDHDGCQLSKRCCKISSRDTGMECTKSIASGSTRSGSDSMCKAVKNASRYENGPIENCLLPAKRHTRSSGAYREKKALVNLTSRKQLEHQLDHHRSSQYMFRPLLSSVPASSFYSIRSAGKHCLPASLLPESFMTMSSDQDKEWEPKVVPENEINHGDEEGKKGKFENGLCLTTLSDLGDDDNQTVSNFVDSAVSSHHVSDLDSKKIMHDEAEITISTDNELTKYALCNVKAGDAEDRINSLIGNWTSPDELNKCGHPIKEPSSLVSCRQNTDVFGHSRENSDHYSSQEGSLVMSLTGKAQGSNSGSAQSEIFPVPTLEYSVDVVEHSFHSDSRVLQTAGVNSLATKTPSDEKPIYKRKDLQIGKKEVQGPALTVDAWEVTQTNENCQLATPSICSLQFDIVDYQQMPPGYLSSKGNGNPGLEQGSELSIADFSKTDQFERNVLCNTADNNGQEGILSSLGVCGMMSADQITHQIQNAESDTATCQKRDMDIEKSHFKLAAAENAKNDGLLEDSFCHELEVEDAKFLDDLSKKHQPSIPMLTRNVTLEEATEMILFCSSIVHEIAYKAAATAMQMEDYAASKNPGTKREREIFFNLSEAKCRNPSLRAGNQKWHPAGSAVRRTFRYVQKQRMLHQRIPTVTVQENLMCRTENAIMGNHEEIMSHTTTQVYKKQSKQARNMKCRCGCCIM